MIIDGIQIETTTSTNSLLNNQAVFTVEFEFDNRLIVCHTLKQSVHDEIKNLIKYAQSTKNIELRRALLNSKYITINIEKHSVKSKTEILALKYELIKANKAYLPYGYNNLIKVGNAIEQSYANILLQKIVEETDENVIRFYSTCHRTKGRAPKPVYCYDKQTGSFISKYDSVKEAAKETGICASNISMCCNKHIKTTGPYTWSYINRNNNKN